MGKVLEMMLHPILRLAAVMTACASLAGCGSPLVKVALARAAGPSAPAAIKPAKDSPQIAMTLVSRGIKFPMQQLDVDGNVRLWAAADGAQVALRDGILISTRGFGRDLMSAEAPSVESLTSGQMYQRSYFDLDGTDTTIRHSFTCTVEQGGKAADMPGTRHVIEACAAEIGTIRNEFWIDSAGSLRKSIQWVSQGVGYAAVDRKLD